MATGRRWTYAELDADVNALARGLIAAGIAKGDRVGIWAPNCAEWTLVQYATAKIGAILVNVNPAYRTHELAYALNQSGHAAADLAPRRSRPATTAAMVEEVREDTPALERVVYIGTDDWTDLVAGGDGPPRGRGARSGWARWSPATRSTSSTPRAPPATPRARRCAHRNILNNGFFVTELINFTARGPAGIPVPFYHCFGMVMGNLGCTTHGATMVIPAPGFDPALTLQAVAGRALHRRVRRADDVHRDAEPPRLRRRTTCRRCAPGSWPARSARSR